MPYPPQPTSLSTALSPRPVVLGVDLTSAGARPGAHRARGPVAPRPFDGERFLHLVRTADRGLLDFVSLDEGFLLHPGRSQVTSRLDTAVAAARAARVTDGIGLIAAVDTVHVEAAHAAVALSSIDRASGGRAGWQAVRQVTLPEPDEAWATRVELGIQAVTQVWTGRPGSGAGAVELDAEGRFRVDHDGIRFAVRGRPADGGTPPPRTPPPVVVRVRSEASAALAGRTADVARIAVTDAGHAVRLRRLVRDSALSAGRDPEDVRVLAEVYVVLSTERAGARARLELVEALEGTAPMGDGLVVADTPDELATLIADWATVGAVDGFLLRPSSLSSDLDTITDHLVPALQHAGLFRTERTGTTLRGALRLPDAATVARELRTGRLLSA
ncbi:LLM class flavin-dependent oxidoreductase [Promicromonospora sp. NPDC050880]|uniref:LLM class flavin-dependent oxidoreductase n=1 Tax=Promicromonospora sp. NPDC050880 TaxID=3364406 RepID=UPI003794B65F